MKQHSTTHRLKRLALTTALASAVMVTFTLSGCSHFQGAHTDEHASHASHASHESASALVLNDGKKWETDQALRTGMLRIRALIEPMRSNTSPQSLDPVQAKAVSNGVQEQVSYLINNCKLAPKADAVLHVLIADMLKGAGELQSNATSGSGLSLVRQALQQYPQYFDHPAWPDTTAHSR